MFSPLAGEVDLTELVADRTRVWVYPKVVGKSLSFGCVTEPDKDLVEGKFGIKEPRVDLEEIAMRDVDLFLCPGLGFDRKGNRIGRGAGYYDRLLTGVRPDAEIAGVCFSYQIIENVPVDENDVGMGRVFTDKEVFEF